MVAVVATFVCAVCIGCEPEPAVFDVAAIDKIEKLVVLPMRSDSDPSAGAILSGMMATRLEGGRWDRFFVVEGPALWRLDAGSGVVQAPDEQRAAAIAGKLNAEAALTGTVGFKSEPDPTDTGLRGMKKEQARSVEFLRNFAPRTGQTQVRVRIVAAETGKVIYEHTATEKGLTEADQLRKVADKAIGPLKQHLQRTRPKRKEQR